MVSAILKIQQDDMEKYRKAVSSRSVCQRKSLEEKISRLKEKQE